MTQLIGKQVVLTLKCSRICMVPKHRAFLQTLALKKRGDTRNANTRPMCTAWSSSCRTPLMSRSRGKP